MKEEVSPLLLGLDFPVSPGAVFRREDDPRADCIAARSESRFSDELQLQPAPSFCRVIAKDRRGAMKIVHGHRIVSRTGVISYQDLFSGKYDKTAIVFVAAAAEECRVGKSFIRI